MKTFSPDQLIFIAITGGVLLTVAVITGRFFC